MINRDPNARPEIPPWPPERGVISSEERDEVRALADATVEDLELRQKTVEEYLRAMNLVSIALATDNLVTLYRGVDSDTSLHADCIDPYAKAVLNVLEEKHVELQQLQEPQIAQTTKQLAEFAKEEHIDVETAILNLISKHNAGDLDRSTEMLFRFSRIDPILALEDPLGEDFVKMLLNRGASDPKQPGDEKPEDIASRLIRGAAVANKAVADNLATVGLAQIVALPPKVMRREITTP